MKEKVKNLILTIVSYINERENFVSKTKLLKLLYLFDVEYYRLHKETYTGFDWMFYHLGPWASTYDDLIDKMVAQDDLRMRPSSHPGYDTEFYKTTVPHDLNDLFSSYKDDFALKGVLNIWGEKLTSQILDYVYFQTEPMKFGVRNEKLDFSHIEDQVAKEYKRPSSGKSKVEIEQFTAKLNERIEASKKEKESEYTFTPPTYDEVYFKAMEALEETVK